MQNIKKMRERILQRPVTDGMTDEQLREYRESVHEEQRGNTDNPWTCMPVSGASYKIQDKPMSDNLKYGSDRANEKKQLEEDLEILAERQNKAKQIEHWKEYIEKMNAQIKRIQADTTLPVATKQRKIMRCVEIIAEYEKDIENAEKVLAAQSVKDNMLRQGQEKQK